MVRSCSGRVVSSPFESLEQDHLRGEAMVSVARIFVSKRNESVCKSHIVDSNRT